MGVIFLGSNFREDCCVVCGSVGVMFPVSKFCGDCDVLVVSFVLLVGNYCHNPVQSRVEQSRLG